MIRRFLRGGAAKTGLVPGTTVYVGAEKSHVVSAERFVFNGEQVRHETGLPLDQLGPNDEGTTTWINVNGVHDVSGVQLLGEAFSLHPLALEDIAHTGQRPKVEEYEDQLFLVLRMLRWDEETITVEDEQVSLVIGASWVLSFQEQSGDAFDPIRERIVSGKGRIRAQGPDYLAYALVDAMVDQYFSILEAVGDRIECVGEDLAEQLDREKVNLIRQLKRELLFLRKSVWPLREVVSALQRDRSELISPSTLPYLRDLYDHTIQIIDTVETYRDMVSGLLDLYMSTLSHRTNEVMKVLTFIATIFIPLSFVAGLYGMNFVHMPELEWRYGYYLVLGVMGTMVVGMLLYFRRRKWF